jgi:hypothetical protein
VEIKDETVAYFVLFVVPGFLGYRVFSAFVPTRLATEEKASLLSLASFGACLFPVTLPVALWAESALGGTPRGRALAWFLAAGVWPFVAGVSLGLVVRARWFLGFLQRLRVQSPIATAWDHFFSKCKSCLVRVTLDDGTITGGVWADDSFASSCSPERDLYLLQQWEFHHASGAFLRPVKRSKGCWIDVRKVRHVEFFEISATSQPVIEEKHYGQTQA